MSPPSPRPPPIPSPDNAVSSRFWTEFFAFIGSQIPEVISLDAVKCDSLSPVTLALYLEYLYSGCIPAFETVSWSTGIEDTPACRAAGRRAGTPTGAHPAPPPTHTPHTLPSPPSSCSQQTADAVELLRLGAFFSNGALSQLLSAHLSAQLGGLPEEAVLEVFRAAVDLKQRRLVTECLVLLLPQFGRCTGDATVAAVIDYMDATLSKAVLTQVRALCPCVVPALLWALFGSGQRSTASSLLASALTAPLPSPSLSPLHSWRCRGRRRSPPPRRWARCAAPAAATRRAATAASPSARATRTRTPPRRTPFPPAAAAAAAAAGRLRRWD